jgi:peptide deformylase
VSLRLCVVDISGGEDPAAIRVLANPEVLFEEGAELGEEGCLSIPAFTERLERPSAVRISAQDLDGQRIEVEGQGLLARALRHEVDHLEGVLFVDRLRGLRRMVEERGR